VGLDAAPNWTTLAVMRLFRVPVVAAILVVVLAAPAYAAGGHGGPGAPRSTVIHRFGGPHAFPPSVFPRPFDPWRFWPPGTVVPRRHFTGGWGGSGVVYGGGVYGGGGYYGVDPSAYSAPDPGYYTPNPGVAAVPDMSTPIPSVVEYPTGWYQLRGDGVSTPFVWVWVPKPPAAPTIPPVPAAPPPPPDAPSSGRENVQKEVYRWVDDDGVAHWTDQRSSIPQRFRASAERR